MNVLFEQMENAVGLTEAIKSLNIYNLHLSLYEMRLKQPFYSNRGGIFGLLTKKMKEFAIKMNANSDIFPLFNEIQTLQCGETADKTD